MKLKFLFLLAVFFAQSCSTTTSLQAARGYSAEQSPASVEDYSSPDIREATRTQKQAAEARQEEQSKIEQQRIKRERQDRIETEHLTTERNRLEQERRRLEQQKAVFVADQAAQAAAKSAIRAHALVIGNSAYMGSSRLPNPTNDAKAIAVKLRSLGFQVTEVMNASRSKLVAALADFNRSASNADLALLFYAGHGVQVNGVNYIIPIDFDMTSPAQITFDGISLNSVVEQSIPGKTKLVFLDACRDNPISRSMTRGISRGLAPITVTEGTLISYATKDGSTAEDGDGANNSPFTSALIEHLGDPDDIAVVLRKVRMKVMAKTNNRQQPWEYGSLTGGALVLSALKTR